MCTQFIGYKREYRRASLLVRLIKDEKHNLLSQANEYGDPRTRSCPGDIDSKWIRKQTSIHKSALLLSTANLVIRILCEEDTMFKHQAVGFSLVLCGPWSRSAAWSLRR